jgi:hypothetical protein
MDFVDLSAGRGEMSSIWQYAWLSLSGAQRRVLRNRTVGNLSELLGVVEQTLRIVQGHANQDTIARTFLIDLVER